MAKASIGIIGAGPGGLTSGMILARRGFDVTVYEKRDRVGGRNAAIRLGDYIFDTGPTFLLMKYILDEAFALAGRKLDECLETVRLDPLYRLVVKGKDFRPAADPRVTRERLAALFPGNEAGLDRFLAREGSRFRKLYPCLQKDYGRLWSYFSPAFIGALGQLSLGKSVAQNLGRYFPDEDLRLCFAFQAKYLGMSPWTCPGFFTMLSYIEHAYGIYHVRGGLNRISEAMAKIAREEGGAIRLETPVDKLWLEGRSTRGVILPGGERVAHDEVIINADFGRAMSDLAPADSLRKYSPEKMKQWKLSCSTFMLYLGVKRQYPDLPHHNVVFAEDYRKNLIEISESGVVPQDPSFYVQNASVTDPTLAPAGKSAIYVLVPVANLRAEADWPKLADDYASKVLRLVEERGGFAGLRDNIEEMKIITPENWSRDYDVYEGATFNLAHNLGQVLYFRPHNRFEEFAHCYLVGGGTHPGSGLPTIYESARISANLICRAHGVPYDSPRPLPAAAP